MGTFNNVVCHYPLPGCEYKIDRFQTKQFSPALRDLIITEDGRSQLDKQDVNFHGWLYFYATRPNAALIEFFAKFSDGVIEQVSVEAPMPWIFFEAL